MTQKKGAWQVPNALPLLAALALSSVSIAHAQLQTTPPVPVKSINVPHSVQLKTFKDPWGAKAQRWRDVSDHNDRDFDAFLGKEGEEKQVFNYGDAKVTLTYDKSPGAPFFVGKINAEGLKPNFCYQLKLVGKPTRGVRGWGALGDDTGNANIGLAGRWWCDSSHSSQTNFTDAHYTNYYKNAPSRRYSLHEIYGYLYTGMFVTDEYGSTNGDFYFTGEWNFHVTRQDSETYGKDHFAGEGPITGGLLPNSIVNEYYGYGKSAPLHNPDGSGNNSDGSGVWGKLWYEYEYIWAKSQYGAESIDRSPDGRVHLPNGKYNCRFVLTEESFHEGGVVGGVWQTVLGSEDYTYNSDGVTVKNPDQDPSNDIVFTIGLPGVPANLSATPGNKQVNLSWTDASSATSYKVKRATASGGPYTTIAPSVTATNFVDNSVTNGTTYYYVVSAVNNTGENINSNEASATPKAVAPQAPTNLTATAGVNQVQLSWTASFGADRYYIKRAEIVDGTYTSIGTSTTTSYADTGLVTGTTYYYVVSAENSAGESDSNSNEASATPVAAPAATPVISPNGGTYFGAATVSLSTADGAAIYYTTNGSDPTQGSTLYSAPFTLTASGTVKARAFKTGAAASNVASAVFTVTKTATLNPTDDAHVRGGSYANTKYGTANVLEVKTSTSTKENRDAYLKFNLQGLGSGAVITSAKLRIWAALSGSGSITTSVYGVSNTTWTQSSITWNTKPALGTNILGSATVNSTVYGWKVVDITPYVQSQLNAGQSTISLALHYNNNTSPMIKINSKEASANKPELIIGG